MVERARLLTAMTEIALAAVRATIPRASALQATLEMTLVAWMMRDHRPPIHRPPILHVATSGPMTCKPILMKMIS